MPLTVFVSSTSLDLPQHRKALERSLLDAGLGPIGMEHFAAQPDQPLHACLREIGEADLFVGIYAWRYGFVPGDAGISITELEFSEAQRLGKPCFCFFVDPGFPWPEEFRDQGESAARLDEFKRRMDALLVRSTFTTPDDLAARVLASIQRYERSASKRATQGSAQTPEQRNLTTLLERSKQFWVAGVLANVANSVGIYALTMIPEPDAVEQHWRDGTAPDLPAQQPLAPGQSILDIFEDSGRLLLILGDPGSGKTITLLQLAQYLIEQARGIASEPVPVVFHLGSWSARLPLEKWLVLEARSKYYVSGDLFEKWLREHRIVLLLDGLDEVEPAEQSACVQSINAFVGSVGVPGIAICARRAEYHTLTTKLRVNAAIRLEALSTAQIGAILSSSEQPMRGLQQVLDAAPEMAEIAGSPLMLNLMRATSQDTLESGIQQTRSGSLADAVVARYVDARLAADGVDESHRQDVLTRLGWIARRIIEGGGNVFQVDALQPSQLSGIARAAYFLLTRIVVGLVLGLTEGIYLGLVSWAQASFGTALLRSVSVGLLFGLGAGLIDLFRQGRMAADGAGEQAQPQRKEASWPVSLALVLFLFALFAASNWALWHAWERAGFGIVWALVVGLRSRGGGIAHDIRIPDIRSWSWRSAGKGFMLGVAVATAVFVVPTAIGAFPAVTEEMSKYPASTSIIIAGSTALLYGLIGAVFMGWRANTIATQVRPDEGIRLFRRSMLRGGALLGAVTGGFLWLVVSGGMAQTTGAAMAALAGLVIGWVVGSYFAVVGALWYGGIDIINHYALRGILWLSGRTPLRLIRYLDSAVKIRLLRRIGGGYAFIHRALLEYFAARESAAKLK